MIIFDYPIDRTGLASCCRWEFGGVGRKPLCGGAISQTWAATLSGPWATSSPQTAPASGWLEFWDVLSAAGPRLLSERGDLRTGDVALLDGCGTKLIVRPKFLTQFVRQKRVGLYQKMRSRGPACDLYWLCKVFP